MSNAMLLDILAADLGLELDDVLEGATFDSVSPGICTSCRTTHDSCEPDADANHCDSCGEDHVKSALVLAGIL